MHAAIVIKEQAAGYGGRAVLRGLDFTVFAGERVAVLGRSGAGKSTLLHLIHARCAAQAALIPQAHALVRPLSVFHNVYMGRLDQYSTWFNLKTLVWPGAREKASVAAALGLVGLEDKIFAAAGALSGGQQQRTSMARALYGARAIVIGDEPVSALDRQQGDTLLHCLAARAQTLVLAMHDVPLALAHATRVIMLQGGRIVLDAPAACLTPADLAPFYDAAP